MMWKGFLHKIVQEYKGYTRFEKLFILFMMITSFSITAEASISRSVSASFFIDAYTAKFLPYAWLASLPLNYLVVALYNRFIPRIGCKTMMGLILLFAGGFNLTCVFYLKSVHALPFFLYLWKDIFIIFLFHKLWSVIHSTISFSRAKYVYGMFFGIGGVGSVAGSTVPSFFAVAYGTEKLLLVTLPLYFLTYIAYRAAVTMRDNTHSSEDISMDIDNGNFSYGIKLIRNSKLLKFILLLVACMQVSSTILDYQFSLYLRESLPELDLRTQFMGRLFGVVNSVNIFLQFIGSVVLLRVIGLMATHAMIPILLLSNALLFFAYPTFGIICAGFGTIKCLDYSIFGISKEMLYIPMNVEEKFKAKSIIDVFAYRSSKAVVSLIIMFLTYFYGANIIPLLSLAVITIFTGWIYSVFAMREYFASIETEKA